MKLIRVLMVVLIVLLSMPTSILAARPVEQNLLVPPTGVQPATDPSAGDVPLQPVNSDAALPEKPFEPVSDPVPGEPEGAFGVSAGTGLACLPADDDCYIPALLVSKDIQMSYVRETGWDIDKTVNEDYWELLPGQSVTSTYTIEVTRTVVETDYMVWGSIWIFNPAPYAAEIASVVDVAGGVTASVTCPSMTVPAESAIKCTYEAGPLDVNTFGDTNLVTVTTVNAHEVLGGEATAPIDWTCAEVIDEGYDKIHVDDSWYGYVGEFSDSGSATYDRPFTCVEDEGTWVNRATIRETGQYDEASVTVVCGVWELAVTKDAHTAFTRTYDWDIDKSVDVDLWELMPGPSATAIYTIDVTRTMVDSAFMVTGTITIHNPSPLAAELESVIDMAGGVAAEVSCPSMTVPAGGALECTYEAGPLDTETFGDWNTVTVTPADANLFEGDTANAAIDFGAAAVTTAGYAAISVMDTYAGDLGTFSGSGSTTYGRTFDCNEDEGEWPNTATIVETGESDSEMVTVACGVWQLTVEKTAHTAYTETFTWDIDKSVDEDYWSLYAGQSATSTYTIDVTRWMATSGYMVTGTITITNPAGIPASLASVVDDAGGFGAGVTCPSMTVPASGTLVCTYVAGPFDTEAFGDVNTVTVVPADTTEFAGASDTAPIDFGQATVNVEGYETINVTDSWYGDLGEFSGSGQATYTREFTCNDDEGEWPNTATIVETGQNDSAMVTVVCNPWALDVMKDAHTAYTVTYDWDIDKSVDEDSWDLFRGDSATSMYTVAVTRTMATSGYMVTGTITISNPGTIDAELASVIDNAGGIPASVTCPSMTVPAGGSLVCTYVAGPFPVEGFGDTNTVTVMPADTSLFVGDWAQAAIDFGAAEVTEQGYETINVTDSYAGDLGMFSDSGSTTYERTFTCDGDEGEWMNTATIVETDESDSAAVTVNCHVLNVTKDAHAHGTRTWTWVIDKIGPESPVTVEMGASLMLAYQVTLTAESIDSGWGVMGTITVTNPAPINAVILGVADVISPAIAANVDCGVSFPYTLVAGGSLTCSYDADLPDGMDRTNTATVTLQNTPSGTTAFTGAANVGWGMAEINEIDECVTVTDTKYGALGTVCAADAPHTFDYTLEIGAYDVCGEYGFTNVASFIANDTGATGSDSWTVMVDVPCVGCTLTPGYWKTHSKYGPAPYDETWALIGEDTPFFESGKTWYQVLWTAPRGNAYYNLSFQYIAAVLNVANGAGTTAMVDDALVDAEALFEMYTPAQIAALKGDDPVRQEFIRLAGILGDYNEGMYGIPHCDLDYGYADPMLRAGK